MTYSGALWLSICDFLDMVAIFISLPVNCLLLYCIFRKSPKQFGNYKNLLALSTCQSIFLASLASFIQLCFHSLDGILIIFTVQNIFSLPNWTMLIILGLCFACVGLAMMILTAQFTFRFFAIHNPENLLFFTGSRKHNWFVVSLFGGLFFFACGFQGIDLSPERNYEIRSTLASEYQVWFEEVHYLAVSYVYSDEYAHGGIPIALVVLSIMTSLFFASLYCGWKTRKLLYGSDQTIKSNPLYSIHNQLFSVLQIQALFSTILIFLPTLLFFILPFFNLPLKTHSNILSVTLVIHPIINPIAAICIIRNYRNAVKRILCQKLYRHHNNTIGNANNSLEAENELEQQAHSTQ